MKNKKVFYLILGLLISLLALCGSFSVSAQEESSSLTLHSLININNTEKAIVGDEFAIIKIADCTVSEEDHNKILNYQTLKRFKSFDCNWADLSSSEVKKKTENLVKNVNKQDYLDIQKTDKNGTAQFILNNTGLYLVIRIKATDSNIAFEPFLVSVPQIIDGKISYHVVSYPKFEDSPSNLVVTTPINNSGRLPQTGQINLPIVIFAGAGITMTILGLHLMNSGKKNEKN